MADTTTTTTTTKTTAAPKHAHVQSLPCNLAFDGPADVSGRLQVRRGDDGLESAFRGRELRGVDAKLPAGCTGLVVDTSDNTARVRDTFDTIRIWEYDAAPGPAHAVLDALAKVDALTTLHSLED